MIKKALVAALFATAAFLFGFVVSGCGGQIGDDTGDEPFALGSGAPSGSHFNLNLIGVDNPKSATKAGGSVIFVPLTGSCQIGLAQGDFSVIDGNCTDGTANFQLPNPDPDGDGVTSYSVFVRALGKPGGTSTQTTCATDPTTGEVVCSIQSSVQTRTKGKQTFTNVSKELLFVSVIDATTGKLVRIPLFDDRLENFFWQYDNNGLKLLQKRFYDGVATNVN
jgi:hypothetical protein